MLQRGKSKKKLPTAHPTYITTGKKQEKTPNGASGIYYNRKKRGVD
jgi:hypothetical protein